MGDPSDRYAETYPCGCSFEHGSLDPCAAHREAPPEYSFCAGCHDHAVFWWDPDENNWRSECCGERAMPVDVEPDDAA